MNKKIRKSLSVLLAISMASSLFVGTAVGANGKRSAARSSELLAADQVLFVTEEDGEQLPQKLKAANGVVISSASDAIKASPSNAVAVTEVDEDEGAFVMVTPAATSSNAVKVTIASGSVADATHKSDVTIKQNWFGNMKKTISDLETGSDASQTIDKNTNYNGNQPTSVEILTEDGESVTGSTVITVALNENGATVTGTTASGQVTYMLKAKDSTGVVGICLLTVTVTDNSGGSGEPGEPSDPETPQSVKVFETTSIFEMDKVEKELPLSTRAKELLAETNPKIELNITASSPSNAVRLNGTKVTGLLQGTATITAVTTGNDNLTLTSNVLQIKVSGCEQADLLKEDEIEVKAGGAEGTINVASTSVALKDPTADNDKLQLTYKRDQQKITVIAKEDFSGDKATVRIETESGDYFDECIVTVIPKSTTKKTFFKDTKLTFFEGEERTITFSEDAMDKLNEEGIDIKFGYDTTIIKVDDHFYDDVRVTGLKEGTTKLTLTIGNEFDTCDVTVTKSFGDELSNVLDGVDDITELDGDDAVQAITSIVNKVEEKLSEMKKQDPEQLNRWDGLDDLMNQIETLENTIKDKFEIEPKHQINVDGVKEFEVVGLAVNADLKNMEKQVKLTIGEGKKPNKGYSKKAVALDIKLFVGNDAAQPKVPLRVTMTSPVETSDGKLLVTHIDSENRVSRYITDIIDGKITICIAGLSTFVFDAVDGQEITDVNVTPMVKIPSTGSSSRSSGGGFSANKAARNLYLMYGNWEQVGTSWKFKKANGYYAKNEWGYINNSYYYFGEDQLMKTGWQYISNVWYYLNPAAGSEEGKMLTGWQQINGSLYYLNTSGAMAADQWVDGYYVNASGARVQ